MTTLIYRAGATGAFTRRYPYCSRSDHLLAHGPRRCSPVRRVIAARGEPAAPVAASCPIRPPSIAVVNRRDARQQLGLPPGYTAGDVQAAYRARIRVAHPDRGGSAEEFRALTESRRILLAAPAPQNLTVAHDSRPWHRLLQRLRQYRSKRRLI